ncbi:MAG: hypothetical protein HYV42_01250 [Candidatus Magasanikbacteria bacterium]|nr:hypothetical protein [Candidatus Magasanikbacteria bacterium]
MSNIFKLLKKITSIGVTFTTIMWSVGVSALLPSAALAAACPTLNAGDMIKVKGKPPIYAINNDGKYLYFWSGDQFKTWRLNYGGYITVTQECFDTLMAPSGFPVGVNFRPGTLVVKRVASDQLYVLEPGNTLAPITMEAAKVLYGTNFKAYTIDDRDWPNYVNRGPAISEAKVHPGMLVKNAGKTWYVDSEGKLREVSESGMTANGFLSKYVRTVPDSAVIGVSTGEAVSAEVKAWTDKTQSGGVVVVGGPTTATSTPGGALNVSLAADTPFAATVVTDSDTSGNTGGQGMISVMKLAFAAGSDGDVKVTSVKLKRGGVSADTDISNMYLYDGDIMAGSNPTVSNSYITFTKSAGLFTVAKGSSKSITVKLDLRNNTSAGKTLSFAVENKEAVVSNSTSVGGSYPVTGNTFTTALVSDLGYLLLATQSPSANGTVDPGTTGFEAWRFSLTNGDQDTEVRKLTLTIVGSVSVGDLANFSLWEGGKQIGSTVPEMATDKSITFDLSAAPYLVTKGQVKNISFKLDIVGGTNRTFRASLQNAGDFVVYDKGYNVFLKSNGTDTFTVIQPVTGSTAVDYSINVGTLTQTVPADSPSGNIADAATTITLAKFLWKANGENVKITSLNVSSTSAGSVDNILANVRLKIDGSQVGSTISSLTANGASNSGWGSFGSSFVIKAGKTVTVTVDADTTNDTVVAGETFVVGLVGTSNNAQGMTSLTSLTTVNQNANTLTVRAGTVSLAMNGAFGDKSSANPTGTVNASSVKVASFVITAGAGEDVEVSQITLADRTANTCTGTYLQNLTLKNSAGTQLGQTLPNPSTTCSTVNTFTFNVSPAVTITNGAQYTVDVYADVKSSTLSATALLNLTGVTATGKTTGSSASLTGQAVRLQNVEIAAAGSFMASVDSDSPVANNYLMGDLNQTIAKFALQASTTEPIKITQFVVSARFSTGATGTMKNVKLVDDVTGTQIGGTVSAFSDSVAGTSAASTTYSHATFTGLNLEIPKGATKKIKLIADFTTFGELGAATTGQTVEPVILSAFNVGSITPFTATGMQSGVSISPTVSFLTNANQYGLSLGAHAPTTTLYRAKLTVGWDASFLATASASSPNSAQTVGIFTITNKANVEGHTATVQLMNFNLGTTISQAAGVAATRALTVYKDSVATANLLATTNYAYSMTFAQGTGTGTTANGNSSITDANFTDLQISSGASKAIHVTLDTTDAATKTTTNPNPSLSVRIGSGQVTWGDGVSTNVTAMGSDLPLQSKTLTY